MKYPFSFFLLLGLLLFACQNKEHQNGDSNPNQPNIDPDKIDYKQVAREICTCAQPSIELNQQMITLQKTGNKKALMEILPKAGKTAQEAIDCSKNSLIVKRSPSLDSTKLDMALKRNCANLPSMLREELVLKTISN